MLKDAHGLAVSSDSPEAVRGHDDAIQGYLKYRFDTPARLKRALAADPEFGLLHVLQGYLTMLAFKQGLLPAVQASLAQAKRHTARATPRERAHGAALAAWSEGEIEWAIAI